MNNNQYSAVPGPPPTGGFGSGPVFGTGPVPPPTQQQNLQNQQNQQNQRQGPAVQSFNVQGYHRPQQQNQQHQQPQYQQPHYQQQQAAVAYHAPVQQSQQHQQPSAAAAHSNTHYAPPAQTSSHPWQPAQSHPWQQPNVPITVNRGTLPGRGIVMTTHNGHEYGETARAHAAFEEARKTASTFRMQVLFAIQEREVLNLDEGMELFRILDTSNDKRLSRDEVKGGCLSGSYVGGKSRNNTEAQAFLEKYSNTPLGLLQNEKMIDAIFDKVDADDNGDISEAEWQLFLAQMVQRDLIYLIEKGWALHDCYWAHGINDNKAPGLEFTKSEWLGDFWYYECNNHHLLAIFLADKHNTLTRLERLNIEFCTLSFILFMTALLALSGVSSDSDGGMGAGILFGAVTMPSVILRTFLDYINQCPCLVRRHNLTWMRRVCFPILRSLGHLVGFLIFVLSIVLLVLGIVAAVAAGQKLGVSFIQSWLMGYIYSILFDFMIPFNPFAWAKCMAKSAICCPLAKMGLAKWQIQREKALEEVSLAYDGGGADQLGAAKHDLWEANGGVDPNSNFRHHSNGSGSSTLPPSGSLSAAPATGGSVMPPGSFSSVNTNNNYNNNNNNTNTTSVEHNATVPDTQKTNMFFSSNPAYLGSGIHQVSAAEGGLVKLSDGTFGNAPNWSSAQQQHHQQPAVPIPSKPEGAAMLIKVPEGFWDIPGQKLEVNGPDGKVYHINVPEGVASGTTLRVNLQ